MDHFLEKSGELWCEDVPLSAIAERVGTPVYVYSRATLERHAKVFSQALRELSDPWIAYSLKSNPNIAVVRVLQRQGFGADVVSGGELARALAAGVPPDDIVFSGVGETHSELARGLEVGIGQFNVESEEEAVELAAIAESRGCARPALCASIRTSMPAPTRRSPPARRRTSSVCRSRAPNSCSRSCPLCPDSTCAGLQCISAASFPASSRWKRHSPASAS